MRADQMTQFETERFRPAYSDANWCRFSLLWGVLHVFGLRGDAGSSGRGSVSAGVLSAAQGSGRRTFGPAPLYHHAPALPGSVAYGAAGMSG